MADAADANAKQHRLRFRTAKELFEGIPGVRADMRTQPTEQDSLTFLRALAGGGTPEEAVTFAAYLLPSREGVWWAHQCLSYVPDALTEIDHRMLDYAEAWVREPDEEMRNEALLAAREAETETPGVWVAYAAGWSGATMGPLDGTPVPPPAYLTPRAVNAAVLGLLARIDTEHRSETLLGFVEMAITLTEA